MRNETSAAGSIPSLEISCNRIWKFFVSTQMSYNCLSLYLTTRHQLCPDETYPAADDSTYPVSVPRAFSSGRKKAAGLEGGPCEWKLPLLVLFHR